MEIIYEGSEIFGMLVSFACCVIFMRAKYSVNLRNLMLTCLCGFITCTGNVLEVFATSPEAAMAAIKVAYIGKCYIMTFGLMFMSGYSSVKLPKHLIKLLGVVDTVLLLLVMTCEGHHLFYSSIGYETRSDGRVIMLLGKGLFYHVWIILLILTVLLYALVAWHEKKKGSRIARMRMRLFFVAVAFPVVAAVIFLILRPVYFDPASFTIVMTLLCFLWAAHKYGLLDTLELAQGRIIEDTKDGVVVVDNTRSVVLYANPVADSLLRKMAKVNGGLDIGQLTDREESVYEFDGKHYEIRVSEIRQESGSNDVQGYIAWIFDMTFIDQYTSDMIKLKEESERASLAKTEFLTHVSHEIRTPMNSIVGYAEMALRTEDVEQVHRYIRNIKESSDTLIHLINGILDISKIETGRIELIKVNYAFRKMIEEVRLMMEAQAQENQLALIVETDEHIPEYLYGDRVKLEEILINLITNGIKYTKEGSVTLRICLKAGEEKRILLHIEVEDTGIGIKDEDSHKVFDKFERLDSKENYQVEGSGLGLPIVKNYIELMDGHITFESTYGEGTRFIVDLWQELGNEMQSAEHEKAQEEQGAVPNSGRVLIVDDNELNCDVASGIMELLGMETQAVLSGAGCLELLERGEQFDIIFMDHMMPEMDGVETMKRIRRMCGETKEPPVVLLTANAVSGVREKMLREGFDDFLSKPIEIDELQRILVKYLGRQDEM